MMNSQDKVIRGTLMERDQSNKSEEKTIKKDQEVSNTPKEPMQKHLRTEIRIIFFTFQEDRRSQNPLRANLMLSQLKWKI